MQLKNSDGVAIAGGGNYVLADLRGGISVIDVQPFSRWLDAIQAMRNAITQLDTYTQFAEGNYQSAPLVVAIAPTWWWGWRGYRHPRFRHRR